MVRVLAPASYDMVQFTSPAGTELSPVADGTPDGLLGINSQQTFRSFALLAHAPVVKAMSSHIHLYFFRNSSARAMSSGPTTSRTLLAFQSMNDWSSSPCL